MFYKEEAEKIRQDLLEKGYGAFFFRYGCREEDSSWHHLYYLLKDESSDRSNVFYDDFGEVLPDDEIISLNSDEALSIIDKWLIRIDINPNPFEV